VEGPLDTPGRVTLNPNAALIDGVTTASAGLNLGFSAGSGLVVTSRDLGAQLPNAVTQVSVVHVYVDRNAAPVASQFVWDAYRSDDNLEWTRVGVAGVVAFDPLLSRFEIPIPPTTARYVKVVTKPIAKQLTTDPQFSDIFVTELQLFDVAQAADVRGRTNTLSGTLNGTGRILLLRAPSLAYDASLVVTHSSQPALVTYALVNGLSLQHRLARTVTGAARVDRSDSDAGRGHEALNRWSGSLALDPLPTLGGTLAYTGQLAQHPTGHAISHNGTAVARADLYEGISSSASASAGWSNDDKGRTSRGTTAAVGFSIVPNPILSTTWNASYTTSTQTGAGLPEQSDWRGILEATASLSPFRSLALAGNVVRLFGKSGASTLVNFNGGLALFPGGDLQLSYAYQESLDSSAQSRTRTHGPGLRWNIRPGWILTSAYTVQHNSTPSQALDGQAFSVNLVITLR
jgi:hypothetical protein